MTRAGRARANRARDQLVVGAGEPPEEQQLNATESRCAVGVAQLNPGVAVVHVDGEAPTEVELHASTELIRETARAMGRLITAADISPPRIPLAARLRRPRGDIGVDPVPTQATLYQRLDWTVQQGVCRIEYQRAEVGVAVLDVG